MDDKKHTDTRTYAEVAAGVKQGESAEDKRPYASEGDLRQY